MTTLGIHTASLNLNLSLQKLAFDENDHPREPAGGPEGGEFTCKECGGTFDSSKKEEHEETHKNVKKKLDLTTKKAKPSKTLNSQYVSSYEDYIDKKLFNSESDSEEGPQDIVRTVRNITWDDIAGYKKPKEEVKKIMDSYNIPDEELNKAHIPTVADKPTTTYDDLKAYYDSQKRDKPLSEDEIKQQYREQYALQKGDTYTDYSEPDYDKQEKKATTDMVNVFGDWYPKGYKFSEFDRKNMYVHEMVGVLDTGIHRKTPEELEESIERYSRFKKLNPDNPNIKKIDSYAESYSKPWNKQWDLIYRRMPSFFRGTKGTDELDDYLKRGIIGGDKNGYNYVATTASPTTAAKFSDGIIIEFDGDSIRNHGTRVDYTLDPAARGISSSINNAEKMGRPMDMAFSNELEVRLPENTPLEQLPIKRLIVHDRWVLPRLGLTRKQFEKKYSGLTKNFTYASIDDNGELYHALNNPEEAKIPFDETPEGKKTKKLKEQGKI